MAGGDADQPLADGAFLRVLRLLWAFFHYWAFHHDYRSDVITVCMGKIISKKEKNWTTRVGNDRQLMCIEDPFETSHDLGRVVDRQTIRIMRGGVCASC